jgi:hypothetical protein
MRDWRRSCFDCMGGIADMAGSNFYQPFPMASDTSVPAPVVEKVIRKWNDPAMTQRRKKLLAVIGNLFPLLYWSGNKADKEYAPAIHGGGEYQQMTCWQPSDGGTSCTGVNAMIGTQAGANRIGKWAFAAHEFTGAWVPYGSDPARPMPSVGDIYLLFRDKITNPKGVGTDLSHTRHCGIIVHVPTAPGEPWITADGGQRGGAANTQAAYLNKRDWELRRAGAGVVPYKQWEGYMKYKGFAFAKPNPDIDYPHLAGGAEAATMADANRLIGWVDIDSVAVTFQDEAFHPPPALPDPPPDPLPPPVLRIPGKYTEADYIALGDRIEKLLAG